MAWEEQTKEKKAVWNAFTKFVTASTAMALVAVALMALFLL